MNADAAHGKGTWCLPETGLRSGSSLPWRGKSVKAAEKRYLPCTPYQGSQVCGRNPEAEIAGLLAGRWKGGTKQRSFEPSNLMMV